MASFGDRRSFGDNGGKFPKTSSPLRPITKQKALKFDNNNLGDFIKIKRKTKKRSVPMKTIPQATTNQNSEKNDEPQPMVFGVNSKSTNVNPFDVEEIVAKNTGDIERLALKEIRQSCQSTQKIQSSQKNSTKCPVIPIPNPTQHTVSISLPSPDDHKCCSPLCLIKNASKYTSNLNTVRPGIGKMISENYLTFKSKYLIQDVQFLLSIISQTPLKEFQKGVQSAVPEPESFHAIASIVLLHLVPVFRHFLNKCTISFLLLNFKSCVNSNSTTQILLTGS